MAKAFQPSFSGGEMSPGLHGRVDVARHAVSLATCRNFITKASGGVVKRPGLIYRGEVKDSSDVCRLLPFQFNTTTKYLIEAGDLYFRFWVNGARLEVASVPVEVVTPYSSADLADLRFTQSADVLYLVHPDHAPRQLRRLTATSFELTEYENRLGPFRPLNANKGVRMASSAAQGAVTITCSESVFTADMVGALVYLEEQELRSIKPWEPAQKSIAVGDLRRSDGKVYKCTAVTSGGSYVVSGSVRPTHEYGRAWDGSGYTRSDGVNNYTVGVEWEYVHSGFGIAKITGYTNGTTVSALVQQTMPASVVGTAVASTTWTLSGDGTTKQFTITGATSTSVQDYTVVVDGVGVQP